MTLKEKIDKLYPKVDNFTYHSRKHIKELKDATLIKLFDNETIKKPKKPNKAILFMAKSETFVFSIVDALHHACTFDNEKECKKLVEYIAKMAINYLDK